MLVTINTFNNEETFIVGVGERLKDAMRGDEDNEVSLGIVVMSEEISITDVGDIAVLLKIMVCVEMQLVAMDFEDPNNG